MVGVVGCMSNEEQVVEMFVRKRIKVKGMIYPLILELLVSDCCICMNTSYFACTGKGDD